MESACRPIQVDASVSPSGRAGSTDLHRTLSTGSVLVAAQLPVRDWHDYIADPIVADALLDRLIHSSHRVELKGESMRKGAPEDG